MSILVGTSSWTDPTLVRETSFYPRGARSAEDRLRYYASIFPVVEVDSTFYAPPSAQVAQAWVDRTPDRFRMDVKAFGLLTGHPVNPQRLWADIRDAVLPEHAGKRNVYGTHLEPEALDEAWHRFGDALAPLRGAGKLGAVVFQWPPWFTATNANRAVLEELPGRLPDLPLAVEFRHGSWLDERDRDRTLDLLSRLGLAYVVVDEPQGFKTSVPPVVARTGDLAIVRFHGHNAANWQRKGITPAERFRYLYREDELREWVDPIRRLDREAHETHALMNNCYRDYGVRNAYDLGALLGEGIQPDAPEPTFDT
ncbi:MAG TPA: DUF72 domain-containing protein [Acidimicrobiia bacterium]|nr:DUF72 domain-containing protein [Acidimicrobiia bacterium]